MTPIDFILYVAGATMVVVTAVLVYNTFFSVKPRERELREHISSLVARLEACEHEKEKQATVITELEIEKRRMEARLQEERKRIEREAEARIEEAERRLRLQFSQEKSRLLADCEKRIEEVSRTSRTASTLFEAVRAGAVTLATSKACKNLILEPDKILCQHEDNTLEAIWPRGYMVGESIVVSQEHEEKEEGEEGEV